MNQKVKDRELKKNYLAVVHSVPRPRQGTFENYLFKDAVKNRVYVTEKPQKGSRTAVTRYRTLASHDGLSLVECELITAGPIRSARSLPMRMPAAGRRQVWQAGPPGGAKISGAVFLSAGVLFYNPGRGAGAPQWTQFSGQTGGLCAAVFPEVKI